MVSSPSRQVAAYLSCLRRAAMVLVLAMTTALSASSAIAGSLPTLNPVPPPAPLPTSASITPSLSSDRPRARAALTLTIRYTGGQFGVPSPVRHSVLRFPAGMGLDIPSLHSCNAAHLRARGVTGCAARSLLGSGRALVETHTGSQITSENVLLWLFLGPPNNLQPTFSILAQGYTPLDERFVFTGSVLPDSGLYGERLVMSIPPIPSLPLEPDASLVAFSLTVGASRRHGTRDQATVRVPARCPAGGFPFAADFTYADGSDNQALARIPCPS